MKKLFILLIPIVLWGCAKNTQIHISGNISETDNNYIVIERVNINSKKVVDSVLIDGSGNFKFKLDAPETDFYKLGLSENNFITLLIEPGEKVKLTSNSPSLPGSSIISGSPGSALLFDIDNHLRKTISILDSITKVYQANLNTEGFDTINIELNNLYNKTLNNQRRYSISFILDHLSSLASIKAIYQQYDDNTYVLNDIKDIQFMKLVSDSLKLYYPGSKHTKALIANLSNEMGRLNQFKVNKLINEAEVQSLDISLPDPYGDTISLSSLQGKYVLLSFWASWDQASITENLSFKSLYEKYKSRGFEIYQVSFDTNKEAWTKAIKFDELPWINVSDLSYPNSKVITLFNIKGIPSNYFVDKDGTIVGSKLHGKALKIKLEQVFGF